MLRLPDIRLHWWADTQPRPFISTPSIYHVQDMPGVPSVRPGQEHFTRAQIEDSRFVGYRRANLEMNGRLSMEEHLLRSLLNPFGVHLKKRTAGDDQNLQ